MYYTIYETTNLINGKKYIGKHITADLDDDYIGSGTYLRRAIAKYGKSSFKRETLFIFENEFDMNQKEIEIITQDIVDSFDYYNLAFGGQGGCIVLKEGHPLYEKTVKSIRGAFTDERKQQISDTVKQLHLEGRVGMKGKSQTEYQKKRAVEAQLKRIRSQEEIERQKESYRKTIDQDGYIHPNTGRVKSNETKLLISINHADVSGENNPRYGVAITDDTKRKISQAHKNKPKMKCPHCDIYSYGSNYSRWHGDNCKMLKIQEKDGQEPEKQQFLV
jgi:hypothetical protein